MIRGACYHFWADRDPWKTPPFPNGELMAQFFEWRNPGAHQTTSLLNLFARAGLGEKTERYQESFIFISVRSFFDLVATIRREMSIPSCISIDLYEAIRERTAIGPVTRFISVPWAMRFIIQKELHWIVAVVMECLRFAFMQGNRSIRRKWLGQTPLSYLSAAVSGQPLATVRHLILCTD